MGEYFVYHNLAIHVFIPKECCWRVVHCFHIEDYQGEIFGHGSWVQLQDLVDKWECGGGIDAPTAYPLYVGDHDNDYYNDNNNDESCNTMADDGMNGSYVQMSEDFDLVPWQEVPKRIIRQDNRYSVAFYYQQLYNFALLAQSTCRRDYSRKRIKFCYQI